MFTGLLEESCSIIYGFQEEKAPTSEVSSVFNVSHTQQEEKSIDTASTWTEKTCSLVGPHPGSGLQPLGEGECQSKVCLILNFRFKIMLYQFLVKIYNEVLVDIRYYCYKVSLLCNSMFFPVFCFSCFMLILVEFCNSFVQIWSEEANCVNISH